MTTDGHFSTDLAKYFRIDCSCETPTLRQRLGLWLDCFGLHCVAVYRLAQWARRVHDRNALLGLLPRVAVRLLTFVIKLFHHVYLDDAEIGPGFYIGHVGTIYIGGCKIGANFSVTHNVTIGIGHSTGKAGVPTIGNNVWVGTGSVIFGSITIGNNVTILPGSIVSRDIPDNCLVGGNPARVALQNYEQGGLFGRAPSSAAEP